MSDDLRRAREAAGLSLEEVSARTRIPLKWLQALERGDTAAFPPGPFLAGYTRQYRGFLSLPAQPAAPPAAVVRPALAPTPSPVAPPRPTAVGRPPEPEHDAVGEVQRPDEHTITLTSPVARLRRAGRMGAVGAVLAVLVVVGLWAVGSTGSSTPEEGVDIPPDQVLLVTSASGVRARVVADGRDVFDGALVPGRQVRFAAHDELSVELDALDGVSLVYNGRTLKPLGAQSRARRLRFVDDHGG